jgi:restriction system protein
LKPKTIINWVSQLWAFSKRIEIEDLVVLPLKGQDVIAIGKISGDYKHLGHNPPGAKHTRSVSWIVQDMPRSRLEQDLLYSLGAFMTVCQIQRNNAESRIRAALNQPSARSRVVKSSEIESIGGADDSGADDSGADIDLEDYAATKIRSHVAENFSGHRLAEIVDAILKAQGYQTDVSRPGPDGGVDIIAGRGPMGFDPPRLCVQVKSGDQQQDVKVIRELKGTMKDFGADQGLFVSWGGFKRTVKAEARRQFFEIRLWDASDVVAAVQRYYDQLSEDLKADLPLKRIWMLVQEDS